MVIVLWSVYYECYLEGILIFKKSYTLVLNITTQFCRNHILVIGVVLKHNVNYLRVISVVLGEVTSLHITLRWH